MLFSSCRRLSGWKFCEMRCEASKLWRTGILSPCFPFADFSGSLPTVKHFKYSVESLRSLRFVFFFFPPSAWKGKSVVYLNFWSLLRREHKCWRLTAWSDLPDFWGWLMFLLFSFHSRPLKYYHFFSTWLETCAICLLLPLREHWGKTRVPSLAQQLNLAVPCLLGCVTASPLTEMD